MFSFINLLWLIAIIGIVVSIGPCIYVILAPFRRTMWNLAKVIWNEVIMRLH